MKQVIMKKMFIAGVALLAVPTALLAQKEDKDKSDKKSVQQIIITRTGDNDGKTVIEIDGDKVKVNGKDAEDNKDVHVSIHNMKGNNVYRLRTNSGNNDYSFNFDEPMSLFSEDENRAMLGVVTEGSDKGAEVQSITKESAAEKAGLKAGDVITKIDDKKIESTDDVTDAVHAHKPGDKVNITVLRNGKEQKITAELGKWKGIKMNAVAMPKIAEMQHWNEEMAPGQPPMTYNFNGNVWSTGGRQKLGLSIQDTEDGKGVKVLDVDDDSNADKAGIEEGDIITNIDDKEIKSTEDVTRIVRENKDKYTFNFKILRDGKAQTLEVKMPRKLKTTDL
jgi:serine protease Do